MYVYTKSVAEKILNRPVAKVTELAFVFAVTPAGRRCVFVSKKAFIKTSQLMDADDRLSLAMHKEWQIHPDRKESSIDAKLKVFVNRFKRSGLKCVQINGRTVEGVLPRDEFELIVAKQIAKEQGWQIKNGVVFTTL